MLTDELAHRLHAAADEQPFLPSLAPVLPRARRIQVRRRVGLAGGIATLCAVAAVGTIAVVDVAHSTSTASDSAAQPQSVLPVSVTTKFDQTNDVTCAVLTFTDTGDNIDAACSRISSDKQAAGIVSSGGFGQARVNAGAPATTIALGEVAGGGTVVITDNTGRQIRAAIVPPPAGYPYSVYYADLGTGSRWPARITYRAPNGAQHTYNMATPAPSATTSPG
jgi:hypothetical protein